MGMAGVGFLLKRSPGAAGGVSAAFAGAGLLGSKFPNPWA